MTTDQLERPKQNCSQQEKSKPDPALKRLDVLVGDWKLSGSAADENGRQITGETHGEWILGGYFMKLTGTIRFEGMTVEAIQIIGYDPESDTFPATAFARGSSKGVPYTINIRGQTFEHFHKDATYHGKISDDGNVIEGGWRPNEGVKPNESNNYDMTMTRLR
jgi:hypothetical protein